MKILTTISRIFVGILFIISGFIKANDPLGFSYKLEEYFHVFGMEWMVPLALFLAIFICVFEVILGFQVLIGARIKLALWLLLLMIVFFTFLTFYSAYYNKVTDCGCFGDALHLTPWQSFTKDIVLLIFIVVLFLGKKHLSPLLGRKAENIILLLIIAASTAFPLYTYNYLPVIDFRPYAIGKNIPEQMKLPEGAKPDIYENILTYKNTKTGEVKDFSQKNYPWQDSTWVWVNTQNKLIQKGDEPKIHDFNIKNLEGDDYTGDIINNPNYNFILVAYDLDKTNKGAFNRINDFALLCQKDSIPFIGLTASGAGKVNEFRHDVQAMFDFYNTDGTVLKTMIRSNPGLILLKGGVVIDMWHYHSFPSYSYVKDKYFNK